METVTNYKVVENTNVENLRDHVVGLIRNHGWQPLGSVRVRELKNGLDMYTQTLVQYK